MQTFEPIVREHRVEFQRIAIQGVGLIGGSIALAARQASLCNEVIGIGRNVDRLARAQQAGVIDRGVTDLADLPAVDVAIVCTPVDRCADDIVSLLQQTGPSTLVMDAGSVKGAIVRTVEQRTENHGRFVGAHPLAGSHRTGFENADPELFRGRLCVLTPHDAITAETRERARNFWRLLGMRVDEKTPEDHDRLLALTSHLPHLTAAALVSVVRESDLEFAASGFRDTTRVAAGDPDLWTAIFSLNADQLGRVTDELLESLTRFRKALAENDADRIRSLLNDACQRRQQYHEPSRD